MKSDDFDGDDCLVDGEPKHHVLAGDPEATALFDALAEKGVHSIKAVFRTEDGSPRIDVWRPVPTEGQEMSADAFFNEVDRHRMTLEDVVLRGLEMSLTLQNDFVATVFVDVTKRSINVADIHELMFEGDLPNPENGIDL
jgi:hypothetical protein